MTSRMDSMVNLVRAVIRLAMFPFRISSPDVDRDHRNLSKRLTRSGEAFDINITKDKDKDALWITQRKK